MEWQPVCIRSSIYVMGEAGKSRKMIKVKAS